MTKSATAYRTISEVSSDLKVPQHVLRFWETKFPQIRPLKRGGGRRYYRPEDLELLRRIQALLYEDRYTIKGVQRLLREGRLANPSPPLPEDADEPPEGALGGAVAAIDDHALSDDARLEIQGVLDELRALRLTLARVGRRGDKKE